MGRRKPPYSLITQDQVLESDTPPAPGDSEWQTSGWDVGSHLVGQGRKTFYDLDVLTQRPQVVSRVPGNAVIAVDRRTEGAKDHSGMWQLLDVLAGQADAQSLRDEGHQSPFQLGILEHPRRKANLLTGAVQPIPEARMRLLRHTDKE